MNLLLAAVVAFQSDAALPKIAEIESIAGTVELVDAKKASRAVTKFGRRLKNADVRDEDTVRTGAGAQAVIVFPDRSRYTLKEKSEVQILQKQLPKPTPEGNTIGRRLRLLVGNLTSEVMPNTEIRTDFETPAGSAAVRGTMLRLAYDPAAKSLELAVNAGHVRYFNKEFDTVLDVPQGASAAFTLGSLSIHVRGGTLEGAIGNQEFRLGPGAQLKVSDSGTGFDVESYGRPDAAECRNVNAPTYHVITTNLLGLQHAPLARQEDLKFDPNGQTGGALNISKWTLITAPETEYYESNGIPSAEENPIGDAASNLGTSEENILQDTSSSSSSSSSSTSSTPPPGPTFPITIDNFNRANGPVGNGWTIETGGTWVISGNRVGVSPVLGLQEHMARPIGNLPTWNFQTTFNLGNITTQPFLEVNGAASPLNGCHVVFVPGTLTLKVGDATGLLTSGVVSGTFMPGADLVLTNSFNGSQFCASISGAGVSGTVCKAGSSFTWAGSLLRVGRADFGMMFNFQIDDVIRNQ